MYVGRCVTDVANRVYQVHHNFDVEVFLVEVSFGNRTEDADGDCSDDQCS